MQAPSPTPSAQVAGQQARNANGPKPRIRWGVIGTNWITAAFVEAGRTVSGFEPAAVLSRDRARAESFAAEIGARTSHDRIAEFAADPGVDAVYIASPNSLHAPQAIEVLRAGKAVLCEKPLAASAALAREMVLAAEAGGALLMEAYVAPFEPNFLALVENLPRIGTVRRVVLAKDQYSSRYDRYRAGELPNAFNPRMAAGSLMDLGIYTVAPAIHLFGRPDSVSATGILLDSGADGQGTVLLGYQGMQVVGMHSKISASPAWSHFEGEAGTISTDDASVPTQIELRDRTGRVHDLTREQSQHHMRYEIAHFQDLLRQGLKQSPVQTHDRSIAVLEVLDEARKQVGVRFPTDAQP